MLITLFPRTSILKYLTFYLYNKLLIKPRKVGQRDTNAHAQTRTFQYRNYYYEIKWKKREFAHNLNRKEEKQKVGRIDVYSPKILASLYTMAEPKYNFNDLSTSKTYKQVIIKVIKIFSFSFFHSHFLISSFFEFDDIFCFVHQVHPMNTFHMSIATAKKDNLSLKHSLCLDFHPSDS